VDSSGICIFLIKGIGIYKESRNNSLTIQLEILKEALGIDKANEMLKKVV
jgi:hypothetical protein